jgi:phosphoribosyl 1,2-cyclic phosphodiesterase
MTECGTRAGDRDKEHGGHVRLTFLGVRGSTPAPGHEFVRYGGHTSCVVVSHDDSDAPTLVLDAGTGLRSLTKILAGSPFRGTILLTHLHWDHVQGVPFFAAGDRDNSRVDVYLPAQDGKNGVDLMSQFLSPPAFPITPEGLHGTWSFHAINPSRFVADGFDVDAVEVIHKGGRTFGYRIADSKGSVGFLPDHAPAAGVTDAAFAALEGVDVLVHDAQFLDSERAIADDYGHATVTDAIAFAERIEAGSLVLFHHGPHRVDDDLDRLLDGLAPSMPVSIAHEGLRIDVTGTAR